MTKHDSQIIHTDFNTIKEYDQDYRISTRVTFSASGNYNCRATLWKSYSGKVRGDPLYTSRNRTNVKKEVEEELQSSVDRCKEKLEDIERAKLLEIDVTVK